MSKWVNIHKISSSRFVYLLFFFFEGFQDMGVSIENNNKYFVSSTTKHKNKAGNSIQSRDSNKKSEREQNKAS